MNLLSWNCWGLGNPRTVRDLHHMVKERRPNFVFLMETFCSKQYMERIRIKLQFDYVFVVDPVGRSGGLALFWSNQTELEIYNYSRRHIHAVVKDREGQFSWRLTGFYGHPDCNKRDESWAILRFLSSLSPSPWLCVGDFNEIVEQAEKEDSLLRRDSQMNHFREALEFCQLGDLGFSGPRFTWCNNRMDSYFTKVRLDRAVANPDWCSAFPKVFVLVLPARASDHNPLSVSFSESISEGIPHRRGFKFETWWEKDVECSNIIKEAWGNSWAEEGSVAGIQARLSACQRALSGWSNRKYGRMEKLIKEKSEKLLTLQNSSSPAMVAQIKQLQQEIDGLLEKEEMFWKQRAKQHWIADEQGRVWRKRRDVGRVFVEHFSRIFTSQGPSRVEACTSRVAPKVSDEMNSRLLRPFSEEEVRTALLQMAPLKSPGPDGFPADFYQKNWETVGGDVCKAVLEFLNGGRFDVGLNSTNIVLIPKVNSPSNPSDFRPISLCNVLYKIISKVLANRLKCFLPTIVSPEQSAFVPGRLISDNILVAFESLHSMSSRMSGKKGFMALKLDMSKAYDRLEWDFLEAMLRRLGFSQRWTSLVMQCVRTVSYSILINGRP
jgi:exonuclease III